jgi:hypothetical protein
MVNASGRRADNPRRVPGCELPARTLLPARAPAIEGHPPWTLAATETFQPF